MIRDTKEIMNENKFDIFSVNSNLDYKKYLHRTKDFLGAMNNVSGGKKALDIGIGSGWFSKILAHNFDYYVTGIGLESDKKSLSNLTLSD